MRPSSSASRLRWLGAELLVIVLGVLVALWFDGLRERRSEREDEALLLTALTEEVAENRRRLDRQFLFYERRAVAQRALLSSAMSQDELPADSLDLLWRWALRGGTYDPADGALSATFAAGQFRLLRDDTLRVRLGQWPGRTANVSGVESQYNEVLEGTLFPLLKSEFSLPTGIADRDIPGPSDIGGLKAALRDERVIANIRHLIYVGETLRIVADAELYPMLDSLAAQLAR
jgi:hypothetical protein